MVKTHVCLTVDTEAYLVCKSKGYNLSKIANDAFIAYAGTNYKETKITKAISDAERELETVKQAQKEVQNALQTEHDKYLNDFLKLPDNVFNNPVAVNYWTGLTGKTEEQLRALKSHANRTDGSTSKS